MELTLHMKAYLDKYRFKYLALYHALREAIQDGRLPGGDEAAFDPGVGGAVRIVERRRGSKL